MGGGNGMKSKTARERNQAKAGPVAVSVNKVKDKLMNMQCTICKQTFMLTVRKGELETHQSSRHAKQTFEQCFPTYQG